ncbi:MAG TPA: DUF2130 domain-containing protein, partial [Chitinophagaceae bacterium]|nr:DUF2130 domain-containing protein [Chitinophagaceae bacterium]
KCPGCGQKFAMELAVSEEYKKELRDKMLSFTKTKEEEFQRKTEELAKKTIQLEVSFEQRLNEEKKQAQQQIEESMRRKISQDYENEMKMLRQANFDNEEKLKSSRMTELEFLKKEQELKNKEADLDIQLQRTLHAEREALTDQIRKQELERTSLRESEFQLKLKELEKQLDDQKKLAEEMRRKADQGSMQLQGEVQELLLETILKEHFPFDQVQEVAKGIEGADCIQLVRSAGGKECGKIIYESKRTRNWNNSWVDKLKIDMRQTGADMAILVTQAFPKGMERFGTRDGIWICSYAEVASVATVLRNAVMCVSDARKSEENKGEKMQMLYAYISGNEFRQQIEAIAESFQFLQNSINKERIQMEKNWKEREKQLQKAFINTVHMYGSMKGILGASVSEIPLLEGTELNEDDMAH